MSHYGPRTPVGALKGPRHSTRKVPIDSPASFNRPHVPEAKMVENILAYWHKRGHMGVRAWVTDSGMICSNIGNGAIPPKG